MITIGVGFPFMPSLLTCDFPVTLYTVDLFIFLISSLPSTPHPTPPAFPLGNVMNQAMYVNGL